MSIPPINKNITSSENRTPSTSNKKIFSNLSISPRLEIGVDQYREIRSQKIQTLNVELKEKLEKFSQEMESIYLLASECWEANQNFANDENTFFVLEDRFQGAVETIVKKYTDIGVSLKTFDAFFNIINNSSDMPEIIKNSFYFQKEAAINKMVNTNFFIVNSLKLVENSIDLINKSFNKNLDLQIMILQIKKLGDESHNQGAIPLHVKFLNKTNNLLVFECVLKPRSAHLDSSVITLFAQLNQIAPQKIQLPTYKIVNMNYNNEDISFWEFIEGIVPGIGFSADEYIKEKIEKPNAKKILSQKLERMETILRKINISDLHGDNIIFQRLESNDPAIVPIDLESIQLGCATGLYGDKIFLCPELIPQENDLIEIFNENRKKNMSFRLVPIPTTTMLNFIHEYSSNDKLVNALISALTSIGFKEINKELIEKLILFDMLGNDCPFLTKKENFLYYGPISKKIIIAKESK